MEFFLASLEEIGKLWIFSYCTMFKASPPPTGGSQESHNTKCAKLLTSTADSKFSAMSDIDWQWLSVSCWRGHWFWFQYQCRMEKMGQCRVSELPPSWALVIDGTTYDFHFACPQIIWHKMSYLSLRVGMFSALRASSYDMLGKNIFKQRFLTDYLGRTFLNNVFCPTITNSEIQLNLLSSLDTGYIPENHLQVPWMMHSYVINRLKVTVECRM